MFPRWLSWLVLAGLGYLVFLGNTRTPEQAEPLKPAAASSPETTTSAEAARTSLTDTLDVEHWKRAINPEYASTHECGLSNLPTDSALSAKLIEDTHGNGPAAACGDAVEIALTVWDSRGKQAYHSDKLTLTLGHRDIAQGLDAGLVGMRTGGTRVLLLPPFALSHAKSTTTPKALQSVLGQDRVVVVSVTRL